MTTAIGFGGITAKGDESRMIVDLLQQLGVPMPNILQIPQEELQELGQRIASGEFEHAQPIGEIDGKPVLRIDEARLADAMVCLLTKHNLAPPTWPEGAAMATASDPTSEMELLEADNEHLREKNYELAREIEDLEEQLAEALCVSVYDLPIDVFRALTSLLPAWPEKRWRGPPDRGSVRSSCPDLGKLRRRQGDPERCDSLDIGHGAWLGRLIQEHFSGPTP